MAITGSNLAAIPAGTIPDKVPIMTETPTPRMILPIERLNSKLPNETKLNKYTNNNPKSPPSSERNTASNRD